MFDRNNINEKYLDPATKDEYEVIDVLKLYNNSNKSNEEQLACINKKEVINNILEMIYKASDNGEFSTTIFFSISYNIGIDFKYKYFGVDKELNNIMFNPEYIKNKDVFKIIINQIISLLRNILSGVDISVSSDFDVVCKPLYIVIDWNMNKNKNNETNTIDV